MTALAIVFDLDGTLIDSRGDIARACNQVLATVGRQPLPEETITGFVGDGARRLVADVLRASGASDIDDSELDRTVELFLDKYAEDPTGSTHLMRGARQALDELAHLPLALCTNKSRRTTLLVLDALDLHRHFREIVCGDDLDHPKPHPLPLLHIARTFGVDPTSLIMVGDGPQDIACGRAVGAFTVGIQGGLLPHDRLLRAGPDTLLGSLEELPALIRRLSAERAGDDQRPAPATSS